MKVHKLKRAPKELTVIFSYLYTTLTENSTAEVNSTWKDNRKKKKLSYKEMPVPLLSLSRSPLLFLFRACGSTASSKQG